MRIWPPWASSAMAITMSSTAPSYSMRLVLWFTCRRSVLSTAARLRTRGSGRAQVAGPSRPMTEPSVQEVHKRTLGLRG